MDNFEVIQGFRNGHTNTVVAVYKELLPHIEAMVVQRGGNRADAIDVLSSAITNFYLKCRKPDFSFKNMGDSQAYRKYLYRICRNMWIDWKKGAKESPFSALQKEEGEQLIDFIAFTRTELVSAERRSQLQQVKTLVLSLVEKLSEKCKNYFHLRYYKDLSNAEIAEMLGVKESTPRKQFNDCKKPLQDAILNSPFLAELLDDFPFLTKFIHQSP